MSPAAFTEKVKNLVKGNSPADNPDQQQRDSGEPTYSIQPHPATDNNPRNEPPQLGGGLNSNPEVGAFHARDPYVPSPAVMKNVEQPKSREELKARSAQLNPNNAQP